MKEIAEVQDWLRTIPKEWRIEFARIVGRESRGKNIERVMLAAFRGMNDVRR